MNTLRLAGKRSGLCPRLTIAGVMTLATFFIAPHLAAAKAREVDSTPVSASIAIDGDAGDWDGLPMSYLEESVRVLGIAHDDNNLFIMFRFGQESLTQKILMGGVTIWINGDDKKKETFGIRYQGSKELSESIDTPRPPRVEDDLPPGMDRGPGRGAPLFDRKDREPGTLTLLADDGASRDTHPEDIPGGPNAASSMIDGLYVYEFSIPIAMIGGELAGNPPNKERRARIGFQIGGLSKAERDEMREAVEGGPGGRSGGFRMSPGGMGGGSGGMGPGGGGPGGGGPGGGGPGGGPRGRMTDTPEVDWLRVVLPPVDRVRATEESEKQSDS